MVGSVTMPCPTLRAIAHSRMSSTSLKFTPVTWVFTYPLSSFQSKSEFGELVEEMELSEIQLISSGCVEFTPFPAKIVCSLCHLRFFFLLTGVNHLHQVLVYITLRRHIQIFSHLLIAANFCADCLACCFL